MTPTAEPELTFNSLGMERDEAGGPYSLYKKDGGLVLYIQLPNEIRRDFLAMYWDSLKNGIGEHREGTEPEMAAWIVGAILKGTIQLRPHDLDSGFR